MSKGRVYKGVGGFFMYTAKERALYARRARKPVSEER